MELVTEYSFSVRMFAIWCWEIHGTFLSEIFDYICSFNEYRSYTLTYLYTSYRFNVFMCVSFWFNVKDHNLCAYTCPLFGKSLANVEFVFCLSALLCLTYLVLKLQPACPMFYIKLSLFYIVDYRCALFRLTRCGRKVMRLILKWKIL